MNELSWLIYGADVIPSLGVGFTVLAIVPFIFLAGGNLASSIENGRLMHLKINVGLVAALVVFMSLAIAIPSKQTFMLIAASEYGEQLAQTEQARETGGKAYKALQKWLDDYLKENSSK